MNDLERNTYVELIRQAIKEKDVAKKEAALLCAYKYLGEKMPASLYKFYSLGNDMDAKKLHTIESGCIWVDLLKNQNDPFELASLNLDESPVTDKHFYDGRIMFSKQEEIDFYNKCLDKWYRNKMKIASFCETMETNVSMWAYYSNNHKGFCCRYEPISRSPDKMHILKPIIYSPTHSKVRPDFIENLLLSFMNGLLDEEDDYITRSKCEWEEAQMLASIKDESWKNEKEFRAFYNVGEPGLGEAVKCSTLNVRLKAIYTGVDCSEENKAKLKLIAEKLNVEYHEMKPSKDHYSFEQ